METLGKIFGNPARVKIMRIFLFNPGTSYDVEDVSHRSQVPHPQVKAETTNLLKAGLIRKRNFSKEVHRKKGKRIVLVRRKAHGFILNEKFLYLEPLQSLLINISPLKHGDILKKISRIGKVKLLILSGVFIQDWESRVDILVVGDHLRKSTIESVMHSLEAEIGKEIKYAAFETVDFQYRVGMYDKLIRDILDYPHETVVDKLGIL